MLTRPRRQVILIALLAYLFCVGFSVYILDLKRASLQFHPRDYNYFIEQAAKLADPKLEDRYALNIRGVNFLGMVGYEGAENIFQAIHTEYFRYTYTFLYWVFQTTWPLYLFYSMLYFLPIIYYAVLPRSPNHQSWVPVILFILLFVLYPATFPSIASDLRSRMLFPSAWIMVILAIYYDRPFIEKLALFLFILCIREEALLFGAIIILLNFIRMTKKKGQYKQTSVFASLVVLALVFFLLFMQWGGYNKFSPSFSIFTIFAVLTSRRGIAGIAGITAILVGLLAFIWIRRRSSFLDFLLLFTYMLAIPLTGIQAYREATGWYGAQPSPSTLSVLDYLSYIATSHAALVVYFILLLLVLILDYLKGTKRVIMQFGLGILCVLFLLMTLLVLPSMIIKWKAGVEPARLVWDFKNRLDPYSANILVDNSTYQAFFDFENVTVIERLPLWIAHPEELFYPDNKKLLAKMVKEKMNYAVINLETIATVRELTEMAGITAQEVESNDRYIILRFTR